MPLQALPVDIWLRVVRLVEVQDVLSLAQTCKEARRDLLSNQIWHQIRADHWDRIVNFYDTRVELRYGDYEQDHTDLQNDQLDQRSDYRAGLQYIRKQYRFETTLARYEPKGAFNISVFLDMFTADPDYIPVLVEYLKTPSINHLAHQSIALCVLLAQNYRHGFLCLANTLSDPGRDLTNTHSSSLSKYEDLYFQLSYFDRAFHLLAPFRDRFYAKIFLSIRSKVSDELIGGLDKSTNTLFFKSMDHLVEFVVKLMNWSLNSFGNYRKFTQTTIGLKYLLSYYIEDFSIIRVYAGEVMGHPYVVFAILLRIVEETFDSYNIVVDQWQDVNIAEIITITQQAVKIHENYIFLQSKLPLRYEVVKLLQADLPTVLFSNSGLRTAAANLLGSFTKPLQCVDLCRHFFLIQSRGYSQSLSQLLEVRLLDSIGVNNDTVLNRMMTWFPHSHHGILPDEYNFLEKCYQYFVMLTKNLVGSAKFFILSEMEQQLNRSNFFIHFNALWQISDYQCKEKELSIKNPLSEFFNVEKIADTSSPFGRFFNLHDAERSRILWSRIFSNMKRDDLEIESSNFPNGSLVFIAKWGTYGVVVGKPMSSSDSQYLRIFTILGSLDVYSEDSVELVEPQKSVIESFINACGADVFGMLYVKGFDDEKGRFVLC